MQGRVLLIAAILQLLVGLGSAQDRKTQAEDLFKEGQTLMATRDAESRKKSIEKFEAAIPIFVELGLRDREGDSLNNIGNVLKNLGEFERSLPYLEKALAIYNETKNNTGKFGALMNLTQSNRYLGRPTAEALANQALKVSRENGDAEAEATAQNELSFVYYNRGEMQKALEPLDAGVALLERIGNKPRHASLMNNVAFINRQLGNQDLAIAIYGKALKTFQELGNTDGEADVTLNLAAIYAETFRTPEAIDSYDSALAIFRKLGNKQREATVLNSIGAFYHNLGDYQRARDHYDQAGDIAESIGDKRLSAAVLRNKGSQRLNLGQFDEALEYFDRSLKLVRELKLKQDEGTTLNTIGIAYDKKGEYPKAVQHMEESLTILREVGFRPGLAHTLYTLGTVYLKTGATDKALRLFDEALKIRTELNNPHEVAKNLLGIARVNRDRGNYSDALAATEKAVQTMESLRMGIPGQELRTYFFSIARDAYEFNIDLLMRMNAENPDSKLVAKAFELNERSKARTLLETLIESRAEIRTGVDPKLLDEERKTQARLNARENYRMSLLAGRPQPEKVAIVEREIRSLLDEYRRVRSEISKKSPAYSALIQPKPVLLNEVQTGLLDADTALLEYSLGAENSYLWVVTKDSIKGYRLPKRGDITAAARTFYDSLSARSRSIANETPAGRDKRIAQADVEFARTSGALSRMILPFDGTALKSKRLAIVSDEILQYVPFVALQLPSDRSDNSNRQPREPFLVEKFEVVNLPSASTLSVIRQAKAANKNTASSLVAVLADPIFTKDDVRFKTIAKSSGDATKKPDAATASTALSKLRSDFARLRFSRMEADAITSLAPRDKRFVAVDFAANKPSVATKEFTGSRIVHFATHGIVSSEYPELSGVVLSLYDENGNPRDGFLRLHEIYNMELDADLVVLSACETALGREIKGEGIVGLTRGFMYAGASDVIASLWKVDDRATAGLMKTLYQGILKNRLHPASALQRAQLSMIRSRPDVSPFYWAAFTIQGDWK